MPTSYASYQPSILPAWLQGTNGINWATVLGNLKDEILNNIRTGAIAGMPLVCPDGALNAIGYERQLIRGISESDGDYALRLWGAFEAWKKAGTALGLLLQLEALYPGIPIVVVQQAARAYSLHPDTTLDPYDRLTVTDLPDGGWMFDTNNGLPLNQGHWNRFALLFPGPLPATWTSVVSPPTALSAPNVDEVNNIIAIGNKWRPAKALWMYIQVNVGGGGYVYDWPPTFLYNAAGYTYNGGTTSVVRWATTPY